MDGKVVTIGNYIVEKNGAYISVYEKINGIHVLKDNNIIQIKKSFVVPTDISSKKLKETDISFLVTNLFTIGERIYLTGVAIYQDKEIPGDVATRAMTLSFDKNSNLVGIDIPFQYSFLDSDSSKHHFLLMDMYYTSLNNNGLQRDFFPVRINIKENSLPFFQDNCIISHIFWDSNIGIQLKRSTSKLYNLERELMTLPYVFPFYTKNTSTAYIKNAVHIYRSNVSLETPKALYSLKDILNIAGIRFVYGDALIHTDKNFIYIILWNNYRTSHVSVVLDYNKFVDGNVYIVSKGFHNDAVSLSKYVPLVQHGFVFANHLFEKSFENFKNSNFKKPFIPYPFGEPFIVSTSYFSTLLDKPESYFYTEDKPDDIYLLSTLVGQIKGNSLILPVLKSTGGTNSTLLDMIGLSKPTFDVVNLQKTGLAVFPDTDLVERYGFLFYLEKGLIMPFLYKGHLFAISLQYTNAPSINVYDIEKSVSVDNVGNKYALYKKQLPEPILRLPMTSFHADITKFYKIHILDNYYVMMDLENAVNSILELEENHGDRVEEL
ncbi:MAG: hypothetical protein QXP36_00405 [Conexivisphaerales archaeon]